KHSFTSFSKVSVKNPLVFVYSVKVPKPRSDSIDAPDSQSITRQIDNPKEPLFLPGISKGC
ncbi:MAG TPA: hypothetical protein VE619_04315, partial [Nitrososphaeraceae archaeon]|nr:hypothetical protein [Nitrososphaeraceae archaeon]